MSASPEAPIPLAGMAGFKRNRWQVSTGISGNLRAEYAIIWVCFHTERNVTCDVRLIVPFQDVGFPHNPVVLALPIWLEVFLQYPCGTFLVVLPFCPSQHLVP